MIYLDSAATSLLKPPSVARATAMAVRTMASPGRGGHSAAMCAADTVFACREAAAELFHVPEPERVVFTMNATHALNIAIHSLVPPGDPVGAGDCGTLRRRGRPTDRGCLAGGRLCGV